MRAGIVAVGWLSTRQTTSAETLVDTVCTELGNFFATIVHIDQGLASRVPSVMLEQRVFSFGAGQN